MRAKYVNIRTASGRGVADRWRAQYTHGGSRDLDDIKLASGKSAADIYDLLCALGDNPPIASVADVIGNKGWSYISCEGCSDYVERAVALGEDEPKSYCETCIKEACAALMGET